MNRFFRIVTVACSSALATPLMAQDFDAGVDAYRAGNYPTAIANFLPLAVEGNASAQFNLGVMYATGKGVLQNDAEAFRWYRLAAKQGNVSAQKILGFMYATGKGVQRDNALAHMWYNIGNANGDAQSGQNRDIISKRMSREQIAHAQARADVCITSNYQDCD